MLEEAAMSVVVIIAEEPHRGIERGVRAEARLDLCGVNDVAPLPDPCRSTLSEESSVIRKVGAKKVYRCGTHHFERTVYRVGHALQSQASAKTDECISSHWWVARDLT